MDLSGLGDFLDTVSGAFSDALKAWNAPTGVTVPTVAKNAPPAAGVGGNTPATTPASSSSSLTKGLLLGGGLAVGAVLLAKLA